MLVVVALGGNALLRRGEPPEERIQRHHAAEAARSLAPLASDHQLVVCHGNGPQIGALALESENDTRLSHGYPLDVLGAQTQGLIGYWLIQELTNAGVSAPVIGLLTQTLVDERDPAFLQPTKPVGQVYNEAEARRAAASKGWKVGPDGKGWRRLVPSPAPVEIIEESTIAQLARSGATVVCGGGGGVPVVRKGRRLVGVEGVVDKDLTAATLAIELDADVFVVLTDVEGVMVDFGTPEQRLVARLSLKDAHPENYPQGSMAPKIRACSEFVRRTGRRAVIGSLTSATALVAGQAGTEFVAQGLGADVTTLPYARSTSRLPEALA